MYEISLKYCVELTISPWRYLVGVGYIGHERLRYWLHTLKGKTYIKFSDTKKDIPFNPDNRKEIIEYTHQVNKYFENELVNEEPLKTNESTSKETIKKIEKQLPKEPVIDMYEDKLGTFLVNLSTKNLSDADSREVSKLLYSIGDLERIGDHAMNILKVANEIHEKNIVLSDSVKQELQTIIAALSEIMEITIDAFCNHDIQKAKMVEPLEQIIDILVSNARNNHIERLQNGQCTLTHGFIYSEILTNIERVSDHCSNIAVYQIQVNKSSFDKHNYLNQVKSFKDADFNQNFELYKNKYLVNLVHD